MGYNKDENIGLNHHGLHEAIYPEKHPKNLGLIFTTRKVILLGKGVSIKEVGSSSWLNTSHNDEIDDFPLVVTNLFEDTYIFMITTTSFESSSQIIELRFAYPKIIN